LDGKDGLTLSKIQVFDNWGNGLGEEKIFQGGENTSGKIRLAFSVELFPLIKPKLTNPSLDQEIRHFA
jgi:hypothetical protein